jgi:dolichol-phosphate mannosyltransferase
MTPIAQPQPEPASAQSPAAGGKISVISPTFNEADNVAPLVQAVGSALQGLDHEIVIVDDDSPDRTWQRAEQLGQADPRVRSVRRLAQRGLGFAVMEGFDRAQGDLVACIDSDLQHDPAILPEMARALNGGADLAIGCRYTPGGGTRDWNFGRRLGSWLATRMAQVFLGVRLLDPMSGYFMMRRADYMKIRDGLHGDGFKILLEIASNMEAARVAEVPYTFGPRRAGQSKLSRHVAWAYLRQLYRLSWLGRVVPAEFVKFSIVGATGVVVNLLAMMAIFRWAGLTDWRASLAASAIATVSNYVLNNHWTFRHRVRKGMTFFSGYLMYLIFATVGLGVTTAAYVGLSAAVAKYFGPGTHYHALPPSVLLICQLIAILLGTFFNYALNKEFTWGVGKRTGAEEHRKARGASA